MTSAAKPFISLPFVGPETLEESRYTLPISGVCRSPHSSAIALQIHPSVQTTRTCELQHSDFRNLSTPQRRFSTNQLLRIWEFATAGPVLIAGSPDGLFTVEGCGDYAGEIFLSENSGPRIREDELLK